MSEQRIADALAEEAVAPIRSGMLVGLGTGRTAKRGIAALAERVREEGLDIQCVATSEGAERYAVDHGLTVIDFATVEKVDYLFDGADEVERNLRMLKGSGGAMTRERMVAWATTRCVYMVDHTKIVPRLGTSMSMPIAVMAFGLASIRADLRELGFNGVCRRTMDGQLFITDNGNLILDVILKDQNVEEVATILNELPGVIDHGLFLTEADELLIEKQDGQIERLVREGGEAAPR